MPKKPYTKKVDKRSICVQITLDEDDIKRVEEYMRVNTLTRSTALSYLLLSSLNLQIDPSQKWKSSGPARQYIMYLSSRQYNRVKRIATGKHMKTNAFIRSVVLLYLRSQKFDSDLMVDRYLMHNDDDDDIIHLKKSK